MTGAIDTETELPVRYLAQLNVARMKAPLESTTMADFVAQLETIYRDDERAPGFVWRLRAEGEFVATLPVGDQFLLAAMSMWESVEACHAFVYAGAHAGALRDRAKWFEPMGSPSLVLWWVPTSDRPRVEQGMARLLYLERHGPTPFAFTIQQSFPRHSAI